MLSACSTAFGDVTRIDVPPEVLKSSVRLQKEYLIGPGDQIEVSVWRVPEASRVVAVRPDGMISLPLLQDVKAGGLSPRELAAVLRTALSGRLVNPEVAVIPQQFRQATVYVLGDVRVPGAQPLRSAATAAQALALAGGALRTGKETEVAIIRLSGEGYLEAIPLAASGSSQVEPQLRLAATPLLADDIVFVPESGRAQIVRLLTDVLTPLQVYLNYKLIKTLT